MAEYRPFVWPPTEEEAKRTGWVKRRFATSWRATPNRAQMYRDLAQRLLRMKGARLAWPDVYVPDFFLLNCHLHDQVQCSGDLLDLAALLFAHRDVAKGIEVSENTFRALTTLRFTGSRKIALVGVFAAGKCRAVRWDVAQAVHELDRVAKKLAA